MNKIYTYEQFTSINEEVENKSSDIHKEGDVFFHGTNLKGFINIKENGFNVDNLYITNNEENAIEYAYQKSIDEPILIVMNYEYLDGIIIDDIHDVSYTEVDELKQQGQWIFNGNIKNAIHSIININNGDIIYTYKKS